MMNLKELSDQELADLSKGFITPLKTEAEWFIIAEALEELLERFKKNI
jgi:hypothetical protein